MCTGKLPEHIFVNPLAELSVARKQRAPCVQRRTVGKLAIESFSLPARHTVKSGLGVASQSGKPDGIFIVAHVIHEKFLPVCLSFWD